MVKRENAFSECLALFVEAHKDVEVVVKRVMNSLFKKSNLRA